MTRLCQNCRQKPATSRVLGYDVCEDCEAKAYTRPGQR